MTTMLVTDKTFLLSLLLLFTFFAFPATKGMKMNDMYNFCKETKDVDFCLKYSGTDKRILAARGLYDVLLIAISQCQIQVTEAGKQINRVRQKYSGPIGKERIHICERNYGYASTSFREALELGRQNSTYAYRAHLSALGGSTFVRECEDEWKKNGPIQKSPLTFYNTNVDKLFSIIRLIIDKLY